MAPEQPGDERVDAPIAAAADAHRAGALRSAAVRSALLRSIAGELEGRADALIAAADAETHLGEGRLRGELTRTTTQLELFATIVDDGSWAQAVIDPGPPDLRRMMWPIGPVMVFGASNFPFAFATPGGDTASALAAGCPVVVKAHPAHPDTAALAATAIAGALRTRGLPTGVFTQVAGDVALGVAMVRHPSTAAVAFTGSLAAGRALFDAAASRPVPIPVYAEMGSINPVFVLPAALHERGDAVVTALVDSVVLGAGQFCTNPGVVVAIDAGGLARRLAAELATRAPAAMLTEGIATSYRRAVDRLAADAGVELLAGAPDASTTDDGVPGCGLVAAHEFLARAELRDEVFGPFTLVVSCRTEAQLVDVAEQLDGQLTASVFAEPDDADLVGRLAAVLPSMAGRLVWDGVPTGVAVSPAMQHGGPYPASTDARSTSVGTAAITRFLRPVAYQGWPDAMLPPELRDANPLGIRRQVGLAITTDPIERVPS